MKRRSEIISEMRAATANLPPYLGGPAKSYAESPVAYVANITLLHDEAMVPNAITGLPTPRRHTRVLLVTRGAGDAPTGSKSGVSGYIDTMSDPEGVIPSGEFDPISYTVLSELKEECQLEPATLDAIDFRLGRRFTELTTKGCLLHVLPVLGICQGLAPPTVRVDGHELLDHAWVPLESIAKQPGLSQNYLNHTLPRALGALALDDDYIRALLNRQ